MKLTLKTLKTLIKEELTKVNRDKIKTGGDGLWSRAKKDVRIVDVDLEGDGFGEIRVYFDPATWNVNTDGLIYTDKMFLSGLKRYLKNEYPDRDWSNLDYTEQGMQGDDYVSLEGI